MRRLALALIALVLVACGAVVRRQGDSTTQPHVPSVLTQSKALGRVAYIQDGNLWVQELPNGPARPLTQIGKVSGPLWSPSGRWLLVRKGEELWVVRPDGSGARRLAVKWTPAAWAPNDDRIAYRDDRDRIRVVQVDGAEDKELVVPDSNERIGDLAWSPDGRWVAYNLGRSEAAPKENYAGLWRVPAEGGTPVELYAIRGEPPQCLTLVGWTSDGQSVLFWRHPFCSGSIAADGLPLMMQPVQGGSPQKLVDSMLLHADFLALSPTGKLAAVAGGNRQTWTHKRILVVDPRNLQTQFVSQADMAAIAPSWSPDGNRLAYVAMPDIGPIGGGEPARQGMMGRKIWLAQADGRAREQLTRDPNFRDESPRWLADGSHILFVRLNNEGQASLWLMDIREPKPVSVAELGPIESWFGYYGWIGTSSLFDYWPRSRFS